MLKCKIFVNILIATSISVYFANGLILSRRITSIDKLFEDTIVSKIDMEQCDTLVRKLDTKTNKTRCASVETKHLTWVVRLCLTKT